MSELFLDTELQPADYQRLNSICEQSGYSNHELVHILFNEVWPAFSSNYFQVAGEWAGWSREVISSEILKAYREWRLPWYLNFWKRNFYKEWLKVKEYRE